MSLNMLAVRIRKFSTALALVGIIAIAADPQEASQGRFTTFRKLLQERHVQLTEVSLLAALQNPDPHIRYLAALVLAEDRSQDAVPAIANALAVEKVPETRVNIALALAQLGDEKGLAALQEDCGDPIIPAHLRMYAVKYLLDLHKDGCLSEAADVLRSATDSASRILALSQLPRFRHLSANDSDGITNAVCASLKDRDPSVRIAASHAIVALGDVHAVPRLRAAAAAEPEEAVRLIMHADLQRLGQKDTH